MIPNPYACARCLNLRRPISICSFRQTTWDYLITIFKILLSLLITSNPNTANTLKKGFGFCPWLMGSVCAEKCFSLEDVISPVKPFPLGSSPEQLPCTMILKCKHPEWNFHVLQMLRVAAAIALHFTVSLTLLRVVALEILTTCKAQNMDLHHSFEPLLSLSVPTNSVTVAIPFSKRPEQQSLVLKYCSVGDTRAWK